jgi:hypothetical protein
MDSRQLQGWHADPFGRHEQRYFSAGVPTKLVRDGNVESFDGPPTELSRAGAAVAASATSGLLPAAMTGPESGYRDPVSLGRTPAPYPGPSAPRRRTGLVYSLVALVAVIAVIAFVALYGGFSSKGGSHSGASGADLAAFVTQAAEKTLAQKTADIAIQGGYAAVGNQETVQGNGEIDFAANTWTMKLAITTNQLRIVEHEIVTSQHIYVQSAGTFHGGSRIQSPGGGRWWVSPNSAPREAPVASLRMLERHAARVVPMGSQNIGGLNCAEYVVTLATQTTPVSVTIWVDQRRQLTCQLYVYLQFSTGSIVGGGIVPSTTTEQFLMTFTRYDVPVTITAPAQSDTVTA